MADTSDDPAKTPDGTSYAFFYGTLMAPEVFFTVCYRDRRPNPAIASVHTFRGAVLPGYTRHRVKGEDYPAIMEDDTPGACVRGMVVSNVTDANQLKLDYFEGSEYERRTVEVTLDDEEGKEDAAKDSAEKKKTIHARVYVFKHPDYLEHGEWDFDEFRREKMHKWARADYTFEDES